MNIIRFWSYHLVWWKSLNYLDLIISANNTLSFTHIRFLREKVRTCKRYLVPSKIPLNLMFLNSFKKYAKILKFFINYIIKIEKIRLFLLFYIVLLQIILIIQIISNISYVNIKNFPYKIIG
jgi:hypothetical protein